MHKIPVSTFALNVAPFPSRRQSTAPRNTESYFGQDGQIIQEERKVFQYVGGGWHFQADEVARCVRDGKKESALWGHNKSLLEMEIFDEVRRQGGYTLPKGVEKVTA
ncbi:hypothetical protein H2248_010807 [Termitomyces sp. 'cryptogamus']|nr:hypothetical protein H2248_010807 [Termitomyces sp. 'cryptogamus']